jgi:hypothetical protein
MPPASPDASPDKADGAAGEGGSTLFEPIAWNSAAGRGRRGEEFGMS